jgi:hypothetical protein
VERIDVSEVEKSLVINAKRIFPKEALGTNIEDFLVMIMDRNIKTVSSRVQESELSNRSSSSSLITRSSPNPAAGWVIKNEKIAHRDR